MTEISSNSALVIAQVLTSSAGTGPESELDRERSLEVVCLSWYERRRSRQRVYTDRGTELRLMLPRGTVLHEGDWLYLDEQREIRVKAQSELLIQIYPSNPLQLAQITHHLGNWHRSAQLLPDGRIRVEPDRPLETWLMDRGFQYETGCHPFDPNLLGHAH